MLRRVSLKDYESVSGSALIDEIRSLGENLQGYSVWHINSTIIGGGVAEILSSLVPLMEEAGLTVSWKVLSGSPEFFNTTKQFHNGMHGQPVNVTGEMLESYLATAQKNQHLLTGDADLVVIHDQQPLGLTTFRGENSGRWLWYCHVDPRYAVPSVWYFLAPMIATCDAAVFHLPEYARDLPVLQYFMPPAIDPLSDKNKDVSPAEYEAVLEKLGIDPAGPPIILQVSRFDRLKDPTGVIEAFKLVRKNMACRLILAGGSADDDPEGATVLDEVRALVDGDPDITVLSLDPDANLEINVLQRRADVIVQKSLREGFGLTATEALWKGKPLVATPTGGLAHQVLDGETGLIARTAEEMAKQVERLLINPALGRRLGAAGREHVRQRFILPVYLYNWLRLINLLNGRRNS
ncbi:Glycosyl transferase, family 1 [Moorella glycerini]|uniref:Trehalose synthase n=1 Tax=Neomoorella stamsii TaxID=1266720 RepID=A0A9X7J4B2_9FIRM|nr:MULTISPECIES: glycosyltransferase [Moorella]PRR74434.1 Trehalose synthase [Moorella stamsii]CEP67919.1 Glycosyl transferase, family 1 [Moorella glycerini]